MYYVYVLQGSSARKSYIGFSRDLKQRLKTHLTGGVYTTKRFGKLELVYYEAFKAKPDAIRRERYLKTTKGKRTLKLMLKASLGPIV